MKVVFGGTFDPVHVGHLRMALELSERLGVSAIELLPCYQAVHKTGVAASPQQRVEMLALATKDEASLVVNLCEIDRATPSYTIDTLRSLHENLKGEPLVLVIGMDAANGISKWREVEAFASLCHILVIHRPVAGAGSFSPSFLCSQGFQVAGAISQLSARPAGLVMDVQLNLLDVSSSDIRSRVRSKQTIRYLVSDAVAQYICDNDLYN